ncbi:MAG TPA: hypothetical protein DCG75_03535, partial [Bacteroidales bacterium]|nr:hypothetical protein [Bacteroidales bacterium]
MLKKYKIQLIAAILISLLNCSRIYSQETQNFIIEKVYTSGTTVPTTGISDKNISVNYFDGLGRPIQSVQVAASPDGKDVIQHIAYDDLGRESKKFLPYVSNYAGGYYRDNAATEQEAFYDPLTVPENIADDINPWADIVFEESPLNRVLEQGAPGTAWQTNGIEADHAVHFTYQTNAGEVKLFELDAGNNLIVNGDYTSAKLYKTGTRDENEVWSYEYKDLLGRVVLKVTDPANLNLQTYYVYDDFGLLRYVIPPKAVEEIGTQTTGAIAQAVLDNLCYYYEYDGRKRMSIKKLPGADPVYMVYDNRDRLVLTQDGNLRNDNKWMFTKYDQLNRHILTGIYDYGDTICQSNMQIYVNTQFETLNYFEVYDGSLTDLGYTNQSFPQLDSNDEILSATFYDNYNFDIDSIGDYENVRAYAESIDDADYHVSDINYAVKGLVTGTLTKVLGTTDRYLLSVNLYDDKYRVIRTYVENYLGGEDLFLSKYNFIGTVLKTKQIHVKNSGATPVTINQEFEYDHAFRLLKAYHQVEGNGDSVLMAEMEYNELGQLISKRLHEGLQNVNFEYNIRGWLTSINDPTELQKPDDPEDLFAMQLGYNEDIGLGADPQYNGNISAMEWLNSSESVNHGYAFDYDEVNRLTKGDHIENGTNNTKFDLALVDYDENGNILHLNRFGDTGSIDELTYEYEDASANYTNQLQQVDDASGIADGFDDAAGVDYAYDNNGNLINDNNKGIASIRYNYLNLPEEIDFGSGEKINYIYDAAGVKHAKLVSDISAGDEYKYYIGNMEYNNAQELEYIHTDEGRVRLAGGDYVYDYYLKDHLGNTRVVFNQNASGQLEVEQIDNYYPFGMRFNQAPVVADQTTQYMYNGKELQEDHGMDWYDYGFRMY